MNIGILSMQKVMNYGSFLQSFALKKTLEGLGHRCEFIDIKQGLVLPGLDRSFSFFARKALDRYFKWDLFKRIHYTREFQKRFKHEFFKMLGIDVKQISHFDVVVIGSDEVFNFAQCVPWGFTTQLYGMVENTNKVISYAASFGHTTIDNIEYYGVRDEIKKALSSLSSISVRDQNSFDIIKNLTGKEPFLHVDPVLMFDYEPYVKVINRSNYIIVYTYPNRIKEEKEIESICAFARKEGKKLISIGFYLPWCDETVIPDPFEVLDYIKSADYIITDTFHGCVMSLKFNKKFAALVRDSNKQKMLSLLSQFHLEGRIVDQSANLEEKLYSISDYDFVNSVLKKEHMYSMDYLVSSLL